MNDTPQLPAFLRRRWTVCSECGGSGHRENAAACARCEGKGGASDGALELVLHCTWMQDYGICPRKFHLRYGECVEGTGPRPALNYGAAVHEALRLRYLNMDMLLADTETVQAKTLARWFDAHPQPSDEWRNCGRAQDLIRAYNECYPSEEFTVLGVEEEFEVLVGEIAPSLDQGLPGFGGLLSVPVYLAGRKDLIVAWHDGIWIMDHKTASDWGSGESNSHLDEGRRSFQFRGYAWAERARQQMIAHGASLLNLPVDPIPRDTLPVLGCVGNYLVSRKPYATERKPANGKSALPRNQFHRECYPFDSETLDEWREECLDAAASILRDWQRGKWRSQDTGCGHWGRCEFYDYCQESPSRRDQLLSGSMFRPKEFEREL